ncbi:hypothetical protein AAG906_020790 [Vitis piasezkii]
MGRLTEFWRSWRVEGAALRPSLRKKLMAVHGKHLNPCTQNPSPSSPLIMGASDVDGGIPQIFLKEYGNSLSNFVFLHLPTGAEWRVELLKLHGEVLFGSGWQRFADFYSIGYGHFLLFRYEGSSHFHVLIFDMTASEIEYPYATTPTHDDNLHEVSVGILDDFPSSKTTNHIDTIDVTTSEVVSHLYDSSIPNFRDGALERAKAFKSENPFFIVTMRPSYVGSWYGLFCQEALQRDNNKTTLSVSDGRTWSVKYIMKKSNVKFSSGWTKFARDNSLEVGDVCAFELIKCTGTSLKVVIFQNNEDAGHDHLQQ